MYSIECEYDIGQKFVVFSEESMAIAWADSSIRHVTIGDEDFYSLQRHGLITINRLDLDP